MILDDVWTTEAWDMLRPAFPLQKVGSKILLTTRNKAVASHADPQGFLYQPKCLTEEESWELLQRRAFLRNDNGTGISLFYPLSIGFYNYNHRVEVVKATSQLEQGP